MRYRRSDTVQRSEDFQSNQCQISKGPHNVEVEKLMFKRANIYMSCTSWDFVQVITCMAELYKLQLVQNLFQIL